MIRFGTDGWRAVIGHECTFQNVGRIAIALARALRRHSGLNFRAPRVVVGYDRRFLSEHLAAWCAGCLISEGVEVFLADHAVPTPAVSVAVRQLGADAGVAITASHNPPWFNGVKIKEADGGAAGPQFCSAVEKLIEEVESIAGPARLPIELPEHCFVNLRQLHLKFLREQVQIKQLEAAGLRVVHDAMHGCSAGYFEEVLSGHGVRVIPFRQERDCLFGGMRPEPIPENYGPLYEFLKATAYDVALVNDGDGDRINAVDERGRALTTHEVISLLLLQFVGEAPVEKGIVLKPANTTTMIDRICSEFGLQCEEVPVGFKVMCERMRSDPQVLVALEESGAIAYAGLLPDRDGILAGLQLLELVGKRGGKLSSMVAELHRRYGPHAFERIALSIGHDEMQGVIERLRREPPDRIADRPVMRVSMIDGVKLVLNDESWVMFRPSGTEPIFRIYAEAGAAEQVHTLLEAGKQLVLEFLGRSRTRL